MSHPATVTPAWTASGLRWIAEVLETVADRIDRSVHDDPIVNGHELYFDSDAYLADLKNRVHHQYY